MANKMTTKDLQEVSELLDGESLAYKKCLNYATLATDPTLKKKFGEYANCHRTRFEALLNYLNSQG